jgi:hypothetical protein
MTMTEKVPARAAGRAWMPPGDLVACEVTRPVMSGRHFYPARPERFFVRNHYG